MAAIVNKLTLPKSSDWRLCYQSRVGPVKWLQPYTEDEIRQAGAEQRPILVVPVAFVSEHSETLYELDREYFDVAVESGVSVYLRASTVAHERRVHQRFGACHRQTTGRQVASCCEFRGKTFLSEKIFGLSLPL